LARPRQYDLELSKKSGLPLDINAAAVLLYDDVVAHREAKSGTFTRGLGREERVEYLFFDIFRNARSVIAYPDFNLVSEIFRRSGKDWLEAVTGFHLALRRSVKSIRYQIEQNSRDLLRVDIGYADGLQRTLSNQGRAFSPYGAICKASGASRAAINPAAVAFSPYGAMCRDPEPGRHSKPANVMMLGASCRDIRRQTGRHQSGAVAFSPYGAMCKTASQNPGNTDIQHHGRPRS
jgi:hypothetical protein